MRNKIDNDYCNQREEIHYQIFWMSNAHDVTESKDAVIYKNWNKFSTGQLFSIRKNIKKAHSQIIESAYINQII